MATTALAVDDEDEEAGEGLRFGSIEEAENAVLSPQEFRSN